ncbi:MAG: M50 family metallopeptidase [Gammaproteobacteria bacterium]|nr:M50 family metallopeptidase [Gammaproteobacteria bacterium]
MYFILLVAGAILMVYVPYLHLPFEWMETYFHELSHGLAAVVTGGKIDHINLSFNGAGLCYTRGGLPWLVAFSGYAGATLWGSVLYLCASGLPPKAARYLAIVIACCIAVTALLWIRDPGSFVIIAFIIGVFILAIKIRAAKLTQLLVQFSGIYVALSAIRSPLYLMDGKDIGDGAALAKYTKIPEFFWIGIWLAIAVAGLVIIWRLSAGRRSPEQHSD